MTRPQREEGAGEISWGGKQGERVAETSNNILDLESIIKRSSDWANSILTDESFFEGLSLQLNSITMAQSMRGEVLQEIHQVNSSGLASIDWKLAARSRVAQRIFYKR